MIISIASGKGGTGKTTVATSLALSLKERITFLDCDVEEPNSAFFIKPEIDKRSNFGIPVPEVDYSKCTFCGRCSEVCAYNAMAVVPNNVLIFPELCHGCGSCSELCPEGAIAEKERVIGLIEEGQTDSIRFIQGRLNIGEPMATPIIKAMKGMIDQEGITIIDVPPGTSCPVIEAVKDSDYTILVTEPTPFGVYDLDLTVRMLDEMKIKYGIVINRDGIGDESVKRFAYKKKIPIITQIPICRDIAEVYARGENLLDLEPISQAIERIKEYVL